MTKLISKRRQFIKSLGASAIALPFYDLLAGKQAFADCGKAHRIIFLYHPDGVVPDLWHPNGEGSNFTLNYSMTPLEPFKHLLAPVRGVEMMGGEGNSHPKGAARTLTGSQQGENQSLDRYLANTTGSQSAFSHVHLGVQATKGADDTSSVTFHGARQPKLAQDNPMTAWNDIFGSLTQSGNNNAERSVIDFALAELNDLRGKLNVAEQAKLDLHLDSLRQVEKRIGYEVGQCTFHAPDEITTHIHDDLQVPNIMRMQMNTMVEAMACDLTRVGTLQLSHHTSNMKLDFDEMATMPDNYSHGGSHNNTTTHSTYKKWVCKEIAYLLGELQARPDPICGGTLLDNTLVYAFTEVRAGAQHGHFDMPMLIAGGAGIRTGQAYNMGGSAHSNLLVTLARAMGNNINNFGDDSSGPFWNMLA